MKISYVASIRFPTERAHGYQIARVCAELGELGHDVTLYVPTRRNPIQADAYDFYGVSRVFSIEYVRSRDYLRYVHILGPLAFKLSMRSFLRRLSVPRDSVVYTRDAEVVARLSARGYACVYNAHNWNASRARALVGARGAVCNSKGTQDALRKNLSIPTMVAYNAADPNPFVGADKEKLRAELGLPQHKKIALYAGHLYDWKGRGVLIEVARALKEHPEIQVVAVGGTAADVVAAKIQAEGIENISFLGYQPKSLIPKYLAAADVLLLPNSAAHDESVRFTSPLKLFEYMAAGIPIIASDLPSIREILSDETAFFAPAGDAGAFAAAIQQVLHAPEKAHERAQEALKASRAHGWRAHAEKVADFLAQVV